MEAQTPEKIKIAGRPYLARQRRERAQEIADTANRLAGLYAEMQIGEFTPAILADTYATGGAEARRLYLNAAREDAEKVRSSTLKAQILADAEQWRTPFADEARKVKSQCSQWGGDERYLLGYLATAADGRFIIPDEALQRIEEEAAVYLTDPDEIAKYHAHLAAVDALNALFEDGAATPVVGWFNLFAVDAKGRFSVPPDGVNYPYLIRLAKERRGEVEAVERDAEAADAPTPGSVAPTQQNRAKATAPRMVKGIAKEPDYIDRGAENRAGKGAAISPDIH